MTGSDDEGIAAASVASADGARIAYRSLGSGPGLVLVGGVLSTGRDYLALARLLAPSFTVHVMERRGRPPSSPQGRDHSIDDECADLIAVAEATRSTTVFGHSFGGLVALETARRTPIFDGVIVYEPGVPLRGQLRTDWLDGYQRRLQAGDRRGAFAWMVKRNGFAPAPLALLPLWWVRFVLRLVMRGERWRTMDELLEANLVEHRLQAELDAPDAERFRTIGARTLLLGGAKSPPFISEQLVTELSEAIPDATAAILPGLDHLAPQHDPEFVAAAILTAA